MNEEKQTLKRLKQLPPLFRKQDAEKIAPHSAVFLSRAFKADLIDRLTRGNYINSFLYGFPSVEQVACFLRPPAYISCEWALNHHGIILQAPLVCSVVTLSTSVGKNRNVQYQGMVIEFSRISPKLFSGFSVLNGVNMATPEKAILDLLYFGRRIPVSDELETDDLDFQLLSKLSKNFPATIRDNLAKNLLL
jgi:predicted transcriptional regulator of viral defense system